MATYYPMSGKTWTLQSSISSTQTTITLTSFKVPVTGDNVTMALMNTSIAYGTIAPKTSNSELISFTGITQNADGTATLTGVTRGLDKTYPFTEDTDFKLPHAGASQFILSDAPQVFAKYPAKVNAETVSGLWTFPAGGNAAAPVSGASYTAPTNDLEYAAKKYVDDVAIAGAPDATTGVKGIVQLPTQAQQEAGTATGSTSATLALPNALYGARSYVGYAADAGATDAYAITLAPVPTSYFAGMTLLFKANTANTTTATLNVNTLGAKNLFLGGAGLITGTISAGSFVLVQYDGTQFNILSVSDGSSVSATAGKIAQRNTTGDLTVNATPTATTDATSKAYSETMIIATRLAGYAPAADTNENTVFTTTVTGGLLSTTGIIRIRTPISFTTNATAETWTLRLKYGGTTLFTNVISTGPIGGGNAGSATGFIDAFIMNNGATNAQNVGFYVTLAPNSASQTNVVNPTGGHSADTTSAIDTTSNQTLTMTVQRSNGSGGVGAFFQTVVETIRV